MGLPSGFQCESAIGKTSLKQATVIQQGEIADSPCKLPYNPQEIVWGCILSGSAGRVRKESQ
jgi:hypothetical protein